MVAGATVGQSDVLAPGRTRNAGDADATLADLPGPSVGSDGGEERDDRLEVLGRAAV